MEGIVKKLENDKYLFVIKQQYTKEIQESRFSILEDVKTVNIGNDMAVTLSIGMGMNGDSYIRNYEYARTAIDMALGRGGDQAVVKDGTRSAITAANRSSWKKRPVSRRVSKRMRCAS